MNQRIRNILEDLEAVRENLLALSDDIWLSIDHNDPEGLERGYEFKKDYNQKVASFDALASELSVMVQQYTAISLSADEQSGLGDENTNVRIVKELNREEPHTLEEDFTYCRPHGFILDGQAASGISTWKRLYELVCQQLHQRDGERFRSLPENKRHVSSRGHHAFSPDPANLRSASEIADGIYAEINLSANMIRNEVCRLLKTFEIPVEQMQVFLREDRDAGRARDSDE